MECLQMNRNNCTGCGACMQVCPQKCIKMLEDKEGFLYPNMDSTLCINCKLCEKVCPIDKDIKLKSYCQEAYVFEHSNLEVLMKSSSGGAFTSIAKAFCDSNYIIFGARYDNDFNVFHDYIDNIAEIDIFRKSKYVQSDIRDSYNKVKKFLEKGKKVLFAATPCQIAGLKGFLNKDYEKLLLVDLICHGVPSYKVFSKYLNYEEKRHNSKIVKIGFREKTCLDNIWNSRNIKIDYSDGKSSISSSSDNLYLRGFHSALFYRKSCYTCKYAKPDRIADITIADCWGIEKLFIQKKVHKGQSLVVVNTKKGKDMFNKMKNDSIYEKIPIDFVIKENNQFRKPTGYNKNRDKFFRNLDRLSFDKLIRRYVKRRSIIRRYGSYIKKRMLNLIK